jgi:2-oxoisovalerate dehydrogenase E2 component (dihydrolipoyl transacylase)
MRLFTLPDLGEGLQEAEVVEWHVRPGEEVSADQPMVSVETDKAIVEIPAPHAGRIEKLFGEAGDRVHVGAPLVGFAGDTEDKGAIVGELDAAASARGAQSEAGGARGGLKAQPLAGVKATPAVRALARERGVDLAQVPGTGPGGAITREDVERAGASTPRKEKSGEATKGEPLRGMRRTMAQNMARSHAEVAAVTVMDDADVQAWQEPGAILPRLVRALVAGCRAEPALNAWFDGASRQMFQEVHVGIAVDTPAGLLVPVLRDAARMAFSDLKAELERIVGAARERTVTPEAMRGSTIVLSNFGAIAGRYASPLIVPPTVAILGAGRLAREPVALESGVAVHRVLPLSLTFDHRAVTGGEAARFLRAVIDDLAERG